jgi:hypothetical protein
MENFLELHTIERITLLPYKGGRDPLSTPSIPLHRLPKRSSCTLACRSIVERIVQPTFSVFPHVLSQNHSHFHTSIPLHSTQTKIISMTSSRDQAAFETTKRLLFHLVNEGLVSATLPHAISGDDRYLILQKSGVSKEGTSCVKVSICPGAVIQIRDARVVSLLNPEILAPPVVLEKGCGGTLKRWAELDPGTLFDFMYSWFVNNNQEALREQIVRELRNSATNQGKTEVLTYILWHHTNTYSEKWLQIQEPLCLSLDSPSIAWEGSLLWGHPTHPVLTHTFFPENVGCKPETNYKRVSYTGQYVLKLP